MRRTGLLDSPLEESFDRITRVVREVIGVPVALISLLDDRRHFIKSQIGLRDPWATRRELPLSHSYSRYAIEAGRPFVVVDAREHPLTRGNPAVEDLDAIAYVGTPLVVSSGHVVGTLCVVDTKPREWTEAELALLREFAGIVTAEVERGGRRGEGRDRLEVGVGVKDFVEETTGERAPVRPGDLEPRVMGGVEGTILRIADRIHEAVWIWDPRSGAIEYVNRAYEEIWGQSRELLCADPGVWLAAVHPEDRGRILSLGLRIPKEDVDTEFRLVRPCGGIRWVRSRAIVIRDERREPVRIARIALDITEWKRTSESLRRAEARLTDAQRIARLGNWQWEIATGELFWSEEVYRMFGLDPAVHQASYEAFLGCVHPVDRPAVEEAVAAALRGERAYSIDHRIVLPTGEVRTVHEEGEVHRNRAGQPVRMIGTVQEITERRRAEDRVRFQAMLLDQVGEAVVATDPTGAITYWNRFAERLFGWRGDEVLGRAVVEIIPNESCPHQNPRIRELIESGESWTGELVLTRRDGSEFPGIVTYSPIRDGAGPIVGVVGICADLTDQKRLEEQLRQTQKMEAIGQLAGGLAHDFNNVLTAIAGHAELLLADLAPTHPIRGDLEEILQAANRATSLARQLLTFSRRQVVSPTILDLNAVVVEMERMLRRLLGEDIEFTMELDGALGQVRADRGQIEQVLLNLSVNARDAMPGGGRLRIATRNEMITGADARAQLVPAPGEYVALEVSDNGCGMDAEVASRIFEPFFTTKEQGRGTGLGLSMVYGIVKQSGGGIEVASEPGRGTTLRVYLPRVTAQAAPSAPASPPGGGRAGDGEVVLLAEDDVAVRGLIRRILVNKGYRVIETEGGLDALDYIEGSSEPIDLVITDVVMPGIAGPELASRVAAGRPGTRVLFISGYAEETALAEVEPRAGIGFLEKPFDPDALTRKVRELLDGPAGPGAT